jgi:hypothetical protein
MRLRDTPTVSSAFREAVTIFIHSDSVQLTPTKPTRGQADRIRAIKRSDDLSKRKERLELGSQTNFRDKALRVMQMPAQQENKNPPVLARALMLHQSKPNRTQPDESDCHNHSDSVFAGAAAFLARCFFSIEKVVCQKAPLAQRRQMIGCARNVPKGATHTRACAAL